MNTFSPVAHANKQQKRAAKPSASVWVSASAGTGKTKVLTDRVLALMLNGTAPQRILCLTFTKAAAAEMSNRIASVLSEWLTLSDENLASKIMAITGQHPPQKDLTLARQLFARMLDTPGGMKIHTIHAFCQSVLGRFPLEAGLAPHFDLLSEQDTSDLLTQTKDAVIARAHDGSDQDLADALGFIVGRVDEKSLSNLLKELTNARSELAHLMSTHGSLHRAITHTRRYLGLTEDETRESVIRDACEDKALNIPTLKAAAIALMDGKGGSDQNKRKGSVIRVWLDADIETRILSFDKYAAEYLTKDCNIRSQKGVWGKAELRKAHPNLQDNLLTEAKRVLDVMDRKRKMEVAAATQALLTLGNAFLGNYQGRKEAYERLDYDDLIQQTRTLLETPGIAAWVLFKLDGGLDHILIDEAQDTSPDQWAIVRALTEEFFAGKGRHEDQNERPRTLFAVGDYKQSIFSFQGAAPDGFRAMQESFKSQVKNAEQIWDDVDLDVSFRSTEAVLTMVDAVFATSPAREGVATKDKALTHLAKRHGQGGLVELWDPVEPDPSDKSAPWKPPVERVSGDSAQTRLARLIARKIDHLCNNETVQSRNRPIRAGDILVLVRRRTAFIYDLVRALKDLDIQVAGVDRMVLIEQIAVMDLVALGRFLLQPQDDLTLATVLMSPLIGLKENELFEIAHGRVQQTLWAALSVHAGADSTFGKAHETLSNILDKTDYSTPYALFSHVLTAHDGRRKLLSRLGKDAEDPIDELLAQALDYERLHPPSLEGFLHWLENGHFEVKRDPEHASLNNAVRIMTIHGAKGLQAPIVFLPDTRQTNNIRQSILCDQDSHGHPLMLWAPNIKKADSITRKLKKRADRKRDEEQNRLLYVAMTRAEDRLYVCGWNTKKKAPETCWYNLIESALDPMAEKVTDPLLNSVKGQSRQIRRYAVKQTCEPESDMTPEEKETPLKPVPPFASTKAPAEPSPAQPLMPSHPEFDEQPVMPPLSTDMSLSFQRGSLIHRLLQSLPSLPPDQRLTASDAYLMRPVWGLSSEEITSIRDETLAVLSNEAFAPLFGPGSKAEVPVTGLVDGYALSGQIDRLVVSASEVMVVDFKTNRSPPRDATSISQAYLFQMAAYRAALRSIYPDHKVRCSLLWTSGPFLTELDNAQLDRTWSSAGTKNNYTNEIN